MCCAVEWNGAPQDIETYTCAKHGEFPVLVEQDTKTCVWLIAEPGGERCPKCGEFGTGLQVADPDDFWDAAEREEEEEDDCRESALTAGERNR